ncbi:MAG: hemolysin family protein [Nitrospinota bacterium]|nr:hemolysin family protein [Nitrospinota bacterium]
MELVTTIIIVVVCVFMEAFFSGSELALISISRHKLSLYVEQGKRGALLLQELFKSPSGLYGTTSLGTNMFVVAATAVTTAYFTKIIPGEADLWTILIMAPLTLLFGEIFPKALFQRYTDTISYVVVYPLSFFKKVFAPLLWVASGIVRVLLRQKKEDEIHDMKTVSQEEIRRLFTMGQKEFDLHPEEMKMIHNIFELRHTTVEQCMVPLINTYGVGENEPIGSVRAMLLDTGFSRLPIYSGKIYNVIGIVTAFDILRSSKGAVKAKDLIRPAYYVYRKKKISNLLSEMQKADVQMAVVVDEYSGAIGVVTREDLFEEIFGEIADEYDSPMSHVEVLEPNRWLIHAHTEIDMVKDRLGWDIPEGDYETISGYILSHLERIPVKGENITIGGFTFIVRECDNRGLIKLEVLQKGEKDEKQDNLK